MPRQSGAPKFAAIKLSRSERKSLFTRGDLQEDAGNFRSAFRLFLRGAKSGDTGAMTRLALLYDKGLGVRVDKELAMYWNNRAYKKGEWGAALNAAMVMRDLGRIEEMITWLERAVAKGDVGANVELAWCAMNYDRPVIARNYARKVLSDKKHDISQLDRERAYWMLYGLESAGKPATKRHPVFKNWKP